MTVNGITGKDFAIYTVYLHGIYTYIMPWQGFCHIYTAYLHGIIYVYMPCRVGQKGWPEPYIDGKRYYWQGFCHIHGIPTWHIYIYYAMAGILPYIHGIPTWHIYIPAYPCHIHGIPTWHIYIYTVLDNLIIYTQLKG